MEQVKIPRTVGSLFEWWLLQIKPVVADKLESVHLFGGILLNDFAPKWSDINTCLVLNAPLNPDEAQRLSAVRAELDRLFVQRRTSDWQSWRGVQALFIPKEVVSGNGAGSACYIVGESGSRWCTPDAIQPFDRYMLVKSSVAWKGKDQPFLPPSKESLILQAEKELQMLSNEVLEKRSALWLACEMQNLARAIAFWRRRKLISKTEALRRESASGAPFAEQFRIALELREKGPLGVGVHLNRLRNDFKAVLEPASELLRRLFAEAREKAGGR